MEEKQDFPMYKCHKEVQAIKIRRIFTGRNSGGEIDMIAMTPVSEEFKEFPVSLEFYEKHKPKPGGYYVRYEDGYESYSPSKVFEAGYSRLEEEDKNI